MELSIKKAVRNISLEFRGEVFGEDTNLRADSMYVDST